MSMTPMIIIERKNCNEDSEEKLKELEILIVLHEQKKDRFPSFNRILLLLLLLWLCRFFYGAESSDLVWDHDLLFTLHIKENIVHLHRRRVRGMTQFCVGTLRGRLWNIMVMCHVICSLASSSSSCTHTDTHSYKFASKRLFF